jgi:hypothetical protein
MQPKPRVVTFKPVLPKVLYSSFGEAGAFSRAPSDGCKSPMVVLASPIRELAPTTGIINPAERNARRDVFDFIIAPQKFGPLRLNPRLMGDK